MLHLQKLAAVLATGIVVALAATMNAQSQSGTQIPRLGDGKPDFTGMWDNPKEPGSRAAARRRDENSRPTLATLRVSEQRRQQES